MKTTLEIQKEAIYFLRETVTLHSNVKNGCPSSKQKLNANIARIPALKIWANENNVMTALRNFFAMNVCNDTFSNADIAILFN